MTLRQSLRHRPEVHRGPSSFPRLRDDSCHRAVEVFAVVGYERQQKLIEFRGRLGMESGRYPAPGLGRRHAQCTSVVRHGRSRDKAAPFSCVHEASECGFFHPEALCQFSHSPGAEDQDAQQLGLNGRQIVTFRDPRMDVLNQADSWITPSAALAAWRGWSALACPRPPSHPAEHPPRWSRSRASSLALA
jgi:hypothetical protein